jgi:hypothetical protein
MNTAHRRTRRRFQHNRSGYTLLEVLIASLLAVVLLAGLWGLLGIYSGLYETGDAKAKEAQLVRALMQQLSDDLRSTIRASHDQSSTSTGGLDSGAAPSDGEAAQAGLPAPPAASASQRVGLVGGSDYLELDVLQSCPPDFSRSNGEARAGPATSVRPRAIDLRKVVYAFREPRATDDEDSSAQTGLVRRQLDWEAAYAAGGASSPPSGSLGATANGPTDPMALGPSPLVRNDAIQSGRDDGSVATAPEVIRLEFRYFDGGVWSSEWDSLQRQSLPVAVEVAMQIGSPEEYNAEEEYEQRSAGAEETDHRGQEAAIEQGVYRLLVYLPAGRG